MEPLGFEDVLWRAADKLRGSMDASEYKHVVLGLIFLKYVADATGVFWVPEAARWDYLRERARHPEIGELIDNAMDLIELGNTSLRGVLPKTYARPSLDVRRLGELVDLISGIGLGAAEHREKDILGRVYEYFLGRFASSEGKGGGEFYTPRSVVKLLVETIEPYSGRVYDPCCGSGGMFVQAERFVEAHGGRRDDIAVYGQELNDATWRLAKMNLAIRGVEADLGPGWADSFHADQHPGLKADYILANPPFNISDWGGGQLRDDARWTYGVPPAANANFAWLEHMVSHLSPHGRAAVILANASTGSSNEAEREIRRRLIEANIVDCIVRLPAKLFYTRSLSVTAWFLRRGRRVNDILFINAKQLGAMVTQTHRELSDGDIALLHKTYEQWAAASGGYRDIPGFCRSVTPQLIADANWSLSPNRYVGLPLRRRADVDVKHELLNGVKTLLALDDESRQLAKYLADWVEAYGHDG